MTNQGLIPAVVTPLDDHMGLDIARSLHSQGVPVYGLDSDPAVPGRHSNACQFRQTPDAEKNCEGYLQSLVQFSQELGCRPVLFPLSDYHVLLVSKHRELLQNYYQFVMPDHLVLQRLSTKDGLLDVAREMGIPAPVSFLVHGLEEIDEIAHRIRFPVILKPSESGSWHDVRITKLLRQGLLDGRAKVVVCHNAQDLKESYRTLECFDCSLIVQEVIPGEDARLFYFSSYLNRQSEPLAVFAGRKDRVIPTGFGSASYVHSFHDPELEGMGLSLFVNSRYQGLGGIEFKKDPRDNIYKLIEVNARFGLWDGLGRRCGVDLAYIAYCDTIGLPAERQFCYREGVIWVDWQRDLRAAFSYHSKGLLSWKQWWNSLKGEKMWAIYSRDDPLPGLFFSMGLILKLMERIRLRLLSVFRKYPYSPQT